MARVPIDHTKLKPMTHEVLETVQTDPLAGISRHLRHSPPLINNAREPRSQPPPNFFHIALPECLK